MQIPIRALAAALVTAGALSAPATLADTTSAAQLKKVPHWSIAHPTCARPVPSGHFVLDVSRVYAGRRIARIADRHRLRHERICARSARAEGRDATMWTHLKHANYVRRQAFALYIRIDTYVGPDGSRWAIPSCIVEHESTYTDNSEHPSEASGYYQIAEGTWKKAYGVQYAYEATKWEQDQVATRIWANGTGWENWPNTSRMCGYGT